MNRYTVWISMLIISMGSYAHSYSISPKLAYLLPQSPQPPPIVNKPSIYHSYGPPGVNVESTTLSTTTTSQVPLFNTADWLALFEAFKQKAHDHNPIVKIYRYFKDEPKQSEKPEYKFVPALGFTHYNKIHYYPIVEKSIEDRNQFTSTHEEQDSKNLIIKYGPPINPNIPSGIYPPTS